MTEHSRISPETAPAWVQTIDDIQNGRLTVHDQPVEWRHLLNERAAKEAEFAQYYVEKFGHGTTGHNALLLIDQLCKLVDFILDNYQLTPKD